MNTKRFARPLLGVLLVVGTPSPGSGQRSTTPVVIGEEWTMVSRVLGEERTVQVYTPPGYAETNRRYPVVYLLDGDGHFFHGAGAAQFLAANDRMSPAIVVGVLNVDRSRDFTPGRGAGPFLEFLERELLPAVDEAYRTQRYRILVGHSRGGQFATHALLTRPGVFGGYIVISPSVAGNDGAMVRALEPFFDDHRNLRGSLYLSVGNEGERMVSAVRAYAAVLETRAPPSFEWTFDYLEREDHGSVVHRSIYRGLEAIYHDWHMTDPVRAAGEGGLDVIDDHYARLSDRFGYAIPTPERLVNDVGLSLLRAGRSQEAIPLLLANTERYPRSATAFNLLGAAYESLDDLRRAKAAYERAYAVGLETLDLNLVVFKTNLDRVIEKLNR